MVLEILLTLIFIRPFICSLAFPYANLLYSILLIIVISGWIIVKRLPLMLSRSIKYPLILFVLVLFISVLFSGNKIVSIKELYKYISGISLFLISASLSYGDRKRVLSVIVASGFLVSLLAIYQYFFGFQHVLDYLTRQKVSNDFILDYISRRRAFCPFVTPNTLGGYLAVIIPLTLIYKNKIWILIPLSSALLLSKSLGALLSILLALVIYFCLRGKLEKKEIVLFSGLLVLFGLIFVARSGVQKQDLQPIFSTVMRLRYWRDTLRIIHSFPFTGVGLGNFNLIQSRYAHNSYLQIWAEMGILGLFSLLWLILTILKRSLKNIKNSTLNNQIVALTAANAVFLIHNFVDFSFFLPEVTLIWWLIMGLLYAETGFPDAPTKPQNTLKNI